MRKQNAAIWYDWVGPSGYEEDMHTFEQASVPAVVEETASLHRRIVLKGRCICNSRVAESR